MAKFGEQRLIRPDIGVCERYLFRTIGIADPAHYLHYRYLAKALESLDNFRPINILDAGCGRGDYSFYLAKRYPDASVVGIDLNSELITRNNETKRLLNFKNLEFKIQSILDIEQTSAFDLIICIDVLEHIPNQTEAFHRLASALKQDGYAFYHIPTRREKPVPLSWCLNDFLQWAHEEHLAEEHSSEEFVKIVIESGLEAIKTHKTFGYYTGELANRIFMIPNRNTGLNRILQGLSAPICRLLCLLDPLNLDGDRYALALLLQKPHGDLSCDEASPRGHQS